VRCCPIGVETSIRKTEGTEGQREQEGQKGTEGRELFWAVDFGTCFRYGVTFTGLPLPQECESVSAVVLYVAGMKKLGADGKALDQV